jgi:hypothetical protein
MYTQLFKNAFFAIQYDNELMDKFVAYCRNHTRSNLGELTIANEFATSYQPTKAIWWCTREYFSFHMLNHSLRCMEVDIMADMGFFISDLHQRFEPLYHEQLPSYHDKPFTVYRGQRLCTKEF